jgi:hypothetical protein
VDASVVAVSMRHMDEQQKRKDTGVYKKKESRKRQKNVISVEDIKEGIESLAKVKQERKHFGF